MIFCFQILDFLAPGFDAFHVYDCAEFAQYIHLTGGFVILLSDILLGHRFFDIQEGN